MRGSRRPGFLARGAAALLACLALFTALVALSESLPFRSNEVELQGEGGYVPWGGDGFEALRQDGYSDFVELGRGWTKATDKHGKVRRIVSLLCSCGCLFMA